MCRKAARQAARSASGALTYNLKTLEQSISCWLNKKMTAWMSREYTLACPDLHRSTRHTEIHKHTQTSLIRTAVKLSAATWR